MATIQTNKMIDSISGRIDGKSNIIARVKKFRDPFTGEIIGYGPNEVYIVKKKYIPNNKKQLEAQTRMAEANIITKEIVTNVQHPRFAEMYRMFREQLHSEKPIMRFDNFVRKIIILEML